MYTRADSAISISTNMLHGTKATDVSQLRREVRPNKRLELTEGPSIKSGWGESSSRNEATVRQGSRRTLPQTQVVYPPQLSRGR